MTRDRAGGADHRPTRPVAAQRVAASRHGVAPVVGVAVGVVIALAALVGPAPRTAAAHLAASSQAAASSQEECVRRRMADGEPRPVAQAACVREAIAPTTEPATTTADGGLAPGTTARDGVSADDDATASTPDAADEDGTSVGLLAAAAAGGAIVGGGAVLALRRRPAASGHADPRNRSSAGGVTTHTPDAPQAPGTFAAPPGTSAPPSPPAAVAPPTPDRSAALVTTLVELSDRMSSVALRAEIVAALARAGVHAIEPARGDVFDASRMRGVGSATAPDASWVGRVAGTERSGFHDHGTLLRLPEVIVYTAGG